MFYGNFEKHSRDKFNQLLQVIVEIFGRVYAQDNLIALQRTAGFVSDDYFLKAFKQHVTNQQEKSLAWRLHTITWAGKQVLGVEGDYVECGVYRGFSMAVLASYLEFETQDRQLFLYDTFSGIPDDYNSEGRSNAVYERENSSDPGTILKHVQQKFDPYDNIMIVPGIVPDTFEQACPEKIAFLHLDMNSAKSEIAALEVLFDRISPGGVIVFDDYGWSGYVKQKIAEDAFMEERGHQILELPTGQGLLVKKA